MTCHRRQGFTLVELLVVMFIIAALLGITLVGMRPNDRTQVRELVQAMSSATLVARTRALGNESGASLILDGTEVINAGSTPLTGIATRTVLQADNPPYLTGTVAGVPPTPLSATTATGTFWYTGGNEDDFNRAYKARLFISSTGAAVGELRQAGPLTPWFSLTGGSVTVTSGTGLLSFRSSAAQSAHNTIWPVSDQRPLGFQAACRPRPLGTAFQPPKQAAIDLRYSGVGDSLLDPYGSLAGGGLVAISFDRSGGLDAVMQSDNSTQQPLEPAAPLYLLVAGLSDIRDNTALQSPASRWLAIMPATGRVGIAANVVVSGTTIADVLAARFNARRGITEGVK